MEGITTLKDDTDHHPQDNNDDPFDSLLSLEEDYYTEGYSLGLADGIRSGRIEGRLFGLEKGFDKFVQMGRLSGRAAVWAARLPRDQSGSGAGAGFGGEDVGGHAGEGEVPETADEAGVKVTLPPLSGSDRLRRHIDRLIELTDPESLETKNNEDAVNECDERLAGAKAKFTLISRMVGEADGGDGEREGKEGAAADLGGGEAGEAEVEITAPRQKGSGKVRPGAGGSGAGTGKAKGSGKGEMEDFVGLPLVKKVEKGS